MKVPKTDKKESEPIRTQIRNKYEALLERLPLHMKCGYKTVFYLLFLFALMLAALSYGSLLGCDSQAARLIQILGALAVAVTVVIALSNADPPMKNIIAEVEAFIEPQDTGKETYHKSDLSDELKKFYDKIPDPFNSYRVQFKVTNISNFDWVKPIVTFWLPVERQTPHKDKESSPKRTIRQYHSNTFNTRVDLKMLEMIDGVIISNSNLPYWKQKKHITIWIRMVIENGGEKTFEVEVSIDCENAKGFTQTVRINPKQLLKDASLGETLGECNQAKQGKNNEST